MRTGGIITALLGIWTSAPAHAVDVRLEVAPLVALPLGAFLDGQATPIGSFDLGELGLGGGVQDVTALTDITNGTGGGISISLLLNNWEIRYELAALPYDEIILTHLGVVVSDISFYFATEDLIDESIKADSSDLDPALFHSLGFGYRFEPFPEWVVSPYVPLGLGVAVAQPRNDADTVFGFNLQLGIGAHARIGAVFDLGVAVRYSFSAFQNPDVSLSALQRGATASVSTGSSAFDAAIEILQTITISLTGSFWL